MRAILLSIKPQYVKGILDGTKKYEYRKRLPKEVSPVILIYCSSPVKKIVAQVEVISTICELPSIMWKLTNRKAGICKDKYEKYFYGCEKAYAYELGSIYKFDFPKDLSYYNVIFPPQSFMYVEIPK
jgi:predicted transcriptional regulator